MRILNQKALEHLLFAGYLILFSWLVTHTRFFTRSGLTAAQLVIIFLLKIMAGIFYGWIGVYYGDMAQMVDTWSFHYQSITESQLLRTHPLHYFSDLFQSGYSAGYSGFLGDQNSWWNDLDVNVILKLFGVFNLLSFGHYYINVIFYSFLTLFGPIAMYRVFTDYFKGKQVLVLIAVFFIPSFLYWTSGLHKEGLIFNSIAFIIYVFYFGWKKRRVTLKQAAVVAFSLLLLLALRNYIVLVMLPALLAWAVAEKIRWKPALIYSLIYLAFGIFFFTAPYINNNLDFPQAVVEKQKQFLELIGNSEVPVQKLQPTPASFLRNAPQAISLSVLRPYFSDIKQLLSLAAAVEINGLLLLFLVYVVWNRKSLRQNPFALFCLFFSFSVLLFIGYTVNFLGAIVRYRSFVLPLLFAPAIIQAPWSCLAVFALNINNKKNVQDL